MKIIDAESGEEAETDEPGIRTYPKQIICEGGETGCSEGDPNKGSDDDSV